MQHGSSGGAFGDGDLSGRRFPLAPARGLPVMGNIWKAPGGNRGICGTVPSAVPLVMAISVVVRFRSLPLAAFRVWPEHGSPRWKPGDMQWQSAVPDARKLVPDPYPN
jgi:hypothetical protein